MLNFALLATPEQPSTEFKMRAPTLAFIAGHGLGHPVPLTDLRTMHAELQALGVHPVTETLSKMDAADTLVYLPRESSSLMAAFVIRGEQTLRSRYAVLLWRVEVRRDRMSLLNLFQDAVPGDRVVVVGVKTRWFGEVTEATGVYRVITLT